MTDDEIKKMFEYRPLSGLRIVETESIRALFCKLAGKINQVIPDCAEKTLGLRRLEESLFWFLSAIRMNDIASNEKINGNPTS